jgi:DNA-binding PadR family transcriptional regulator
MDAVSKEDMPMTSPDKQMLKGATTTLLLTMLAERPMHGYELAQSVKSRSGGVFAFSEGTIYPTLYALEDKELVRGAWEGPEGGRRRKVYEITAEGRRALERRLEQWSLFKRGMDLALGEAE